jgi:cyclic AMP-dependent transcription factor ATF-4
MESAFDSGLFSELGDLLGHDPTFYEESGVSSLVGDITKHSFITSSPSYDHYDGISQVSRVPEPHYSHPGQGSELDSLLAEGHVLLDQLMAESGLGLMANPVELADIDELIEGEKKLNHPLVQTDVSIGDMFAQFYEPTDEVYQQAAPISPVSTLPSEPSSPIDLFSFEASVSPDSTPQLPVAASDGLDDLLSSLMDADDDGGSGCDRQYTSSPTGSTFSGSDYAYSVSNDSDLTFVTGEDDSLSTYSSSPSPRKARAGKKKKASTPYSKLPSNRKEKKKIQNKEAAIRYRQKKKSQAQVLLDEEAELKQTNDTLMSEVLNLEREIMCMKELLSDVFNIHSI